MLELAFKFPSEVFARGSVEMQWSFGAYAATVFALAVVVAVVLGYARLRPSLRSRDLAGLWAIRTALLALVLFALLDPRLVAEIDEPIAGHVTVLLDDSLSMRIRDQDGESRAAYVQRAFAPGAGRLAASLERRFDTRYLRFADSIGALAPGEQLTFAGARSDLARALEAIARGPDARSLASVVLVSDGGVDEVDALDSAVRALRAEGITLHAVGVGSDRFAADVEVTDARLPRRLLRGDAVDAEVTVTHRGSGGRTLTLTVEEEGAIVARQPVTLPADADQAIVRVPLQFTESGSRRLVFRIDPEEGETVDENNVAYRSVDVRAEPVRVLHVEGEPRFEVKFLRRAVDDDEGIRLVSLVRTAENKYYRLGVEDADELAGGLPGSDEALFRYDAVVLGSIGNDLLDEKQQARIRDFVSRRGGGLVLLGGRRAFAEGGYAGSILAGLAPVVLPGSASRYRVRVAARPTAGAENHPLLKVGKNGRPRPAWEQLPPLTMVNLIRRPKPGAVTALAGEDAAGEPLVMLAWQRYGRGTVAAFPVSDSWRWQMHADVPLDDETHERLWRNLLRHVARPAGGRIRLDVTPAEAALGETVSVEAEVLDARYRPAADAGVTLQIMTPAGDVEEIAMERSLDREGVYRASLVAAQSGRHDLRVVSGDGNETRIESESSVEVSAIGDEFHGAELDVARLSKLAAATGGRFLRAAEAGELVEVIDDATGSRRVEKRLPLRDMPALLIAIVVLACLEWAWRRRSGLA